MSHFNQLGARHPRTDGQLKVTGKAVYGADICLPGMLYGACRYTDIPAGRIKRIDISQAQAIEGVERVVLFDDIPGNPCVGFPISDYYPLVKDEVFFSGDVVALVAAATAEIAARAVDCIRIEYEPYTPITDVAEALKPEARRIHPERDDNIVAQHHTQKGDIRRGFLDADHVIERSYRVGFQEHAYIEPECLLAWTDPLSGQLTLSGSVQNPHKVRNTVAGYLGVHQSQVVVQRAVMGAPSAEKMTSSITWPVGWACSPN